MIQDRMTLLERSRSFGWHRLVVVVGILQSVATVGADVPTPRGAGPTVTLPPAASSTITPEHTPGHAEAGGLRDRTMPTLPVREHPHILQFLHYFQHNEQGRRLMRAWIAREGRYGAMIRAELQHASLPDDLICVALAESGFDPTVRSNRGAAGMWQFVAPAAEQYGLAQDRFVDERFDPIASTRAAARMLTELHTRFGQWDLALAAYNMGHGALTRAIRKYNTNDYWVLADIEAGLPYETRQYVAKILSCSVVLKNQAHYGYAEVARDAALSVAYVGIPPSTPLTRIARAAGIDVATLRQLNPHLLRSRTSAREVHVMIPQTSRAQFDSRFSAASAEEQPPASTTYRVRFGEQLSDIAARYQTTESALRTLNELSASERLVPLSDIQVPRVTPSPAPAEAAPTIPTRGQRFQFSDRTRVFYRVIPGDTLSGIAAFFQVTNAEIAQWNSLNAGATLFSGMYLDLYVPRRVDLRTAMVIPADGAREVVVGSEQFFDDHERSLGRVRFRYRVAEGDTMASLARRFELSVGSIARINQFSSRRDLVVGEEIILYAARELAPTQDTAAAATTPATAAPVAAPATPLVPDTVAPTGALDPCDADPGACEHGEPAEI